MDAEIKSCVDECGLLITSKDKELEEYFIHMYTEHFPCYRCDLCQIILDANVLSFHKFYGCDDNKAGFKHRTHYGVYIDLIPIGS